MYAIEVMTNDILKIAGEKVRKELGHSRQEIVRGADLSLRDHRKSKLAVIRAARDLALSETRAYRFDMHHRAPSYLKEAIILQHLLLEKRKKLGL